MISRIWHGWTTVENADAYERIVSTEVLPGIAARQIPGFRGAHLLRRPLGDEVEFATIIWFDSIDNVRDFMGEDYAVAHVPPRAQAVLARYEERAQHYDVLLTPTAGASRPRQIRGASPALRRAAHTKRLEHAWHKNHRIRWG
jgi:heme-degrading monooxygenase HmoA